MKTQLSTQEKLWELRKECDYTQEFVAKAVNVATANGVVISLKAR